MDYVIQAQNIRKSFGATAAVKDISFNVQSGKITALLGGNGAGKSTLTKILSGTLAPDAGEIWFDGQSVDFDHYSPIKAKHLGIRVVYQELSLCTNLTANENVLLEYGKALRSWRRDANQLLKSTFSTVFPGHLLRSGVETGTLRLAVRQMIEIARAAADPRLKLLILDEPTSSLDAFQAHHFFNYLRQRAAVGLSVIFIGHRLDEILEIAEEFMV
ncbi:MAG: sugar ABC transporter ATP-binding protein, partial [Verrucomicrobia bacterium]|nr:sugar ABC transporter ATP-binding protein [Verrucomicrobiota bacterium]